MSWIFGLSTLLLAMYSIYMRLRLTRLIAEGRSNISDKNNLVEARDDRVHSYQLADSQAMMYMQKIEAYMEDEQPFLDTKFNMNKMCDFLEVNRTYLSLAINQKAGVRFETFINGYRIAAAIDLLSAEESAPYTLEYLASEVGFQSKSTFNRSFKHFTGINPSEFQRKIMRDPAAFDFFMDQFYMRRGLQYNTYRD